MNDGNAAIKALERAWNYLDVQNRTFKAVVLKCNGVYDGVTVFDETLDGIKDAIALLKAHEPRLIAEADFDNADSYGFLPVWVEDKDDSELICDCITKTAITNLDEDYHYRYWTSRPTDEQRSATPWE